MPIVGNVASGRLCGSRRSLRTVAQKHSSKQSAPAPQQARACKTMGRSTHTGIGKMQQQGTVKAGPPSVCRTEGEVLKGALQSAQERKACQSIEALFQGRVIR